MKTQEKAYKSSKSEWISMVKVAVARKLCRTVSDNQGFTLIELLVVCTILGALVTIAIPAYNNFKTNARNARAMSEIRLLDKAINAYAIDHNSTLPATLTDIGQEGSILDPWGNPYQYRNIDNNSGSPGPQFQNWLPEVLNHDFDLYSWGKDQRTDASHVFVLPGDPPNGCSDDIHRTSDGSDVVLVELL
jgi:general secretion pathway protein G